MIFTLDKDGTLSVLEDANTTRKIQPSQIAAHRRNAEFEAALQAAAGTAGNLTAAQLAALPK